MGAARKQARRHARRRRRLLAALACLLSTSNGLTIPMLDKAESAARATLAKWSLEDAKLRRQVQREMRAEALREEALREEGVTTQSVDPGAVSGVIQQLSSWAGRVLDEEEYRAARIVGVRAWRQGRPKAPLDVRGPLGDLEASLSKPIEIEEAWANTLDALTQLFASIKREIDKMVSSENRRTEPVPGARRALAALRRASFVVRRFGGVCRRCI